MQALDFQITGGHFLSAFDVEHQTVGAAQAESGGRVIGRECERPFEGGDRFVILLVLKQHETAHGVDVGVVRVEFGRAPERFGGFLGAAQRAQGPSEVVPGMGVVRKFDGQCGHDLKRLFESLQVEQRNALVQAGRPEGGVAIVCLLEQRQRVRGGLAGHVGRA